MGWGDVKENEDYDNMCEFMKITNVYLIFEFFDVVLIECENGGVMVDELALVSCCEYTVKRI